MPQVLNLTKHTITIRGVERDGVVRTISPEDRHVSAIKKSTPVDMIDDLPIARVTYELDNLPSPKEDTYLIVDEDIAIAAMATGRPTQDLLVPVAPDYEKKRYSA